MNETDVFTRNMYEDRDLKRRFGEFERDYRRQALIIWCAMFAAEFDHIERGLLGEANPGGAITGQHRLAMGQIGLPFPPLERKVP